MKLAGYFAVGSIAATIDFAIFVLLAKGVDVPWFIAVSGSFAVATLANYVPSIRHAFRSKVRFSRMDEILLVFAASFVGLAVR